MEVTTQQLFDEVLEEITRSTQRMMEDLWLNWSQLGVNNEAKVQNIKKLIAIEKDHHEDVILETTQKVQQMQLDVDKLKQETEELSKCLSVDITIMDYKENMMLFEYKRELEDQIAGYREQVQQRRTRMDRLLGWQRDLADQLGANPRELQDVPLPSEEQLDKLEAHLDELQVERDSRTEVFLNTQIEIKDIMEKLQIKPSNKFEQTVISALSVDFKLTDPNMDRVAKLLLDLQEKFKQTDNRVLELRERLTKLWDCLEEDQIYRENFLLAHQGCHPYAEAAIKEEIKRCEKIKKQKIQVFVANLRTKIKLMWDNVMYSHKEREEFVHYFQDVFTEDTFTLHDLYLGNITRFYNDNKQIFDLVVTRKKLWMKKLELEGRATEPNRYQNRGGQLLKEEKERKAIDCKLPKIEEQLRELVKEYEERSGRTFTVEGKPLLQLMEDDWESRKAERHNKLSARKQALTPTTPLLRSLAGSPLGKRNRTAAGLAAQDNNKPPQKRQMITGSASKAVATPNNNHSALKRFAITTCKRRISGRLAAKACDGRAVRTRLEFDCPSKNMPKVTVNASILKKNKRRSGSHRRSSRGPSSSRTLSDNSHDQHPAHPAHPSHAPPQDSLAPQNPLMESTLLTTYNDFKDRINENQISRSSMAQSIIYKISPPTGEKKNTPKKSPRKAPVTPKFGKENKLQVNGMTPKSNLYLTPTRLTRSAMKLDQEGFATPRTPLSANKQNIQRQHTTTNMAVKTPTHVSRSKSHTQLVRAKNLPPLI